MPCAAVPCQMAGNRRFVGAAAAVASGFGRLIWKHGVSVPVPGNEIMRSIVLGATGIVGGHIVERLVRAGSRPIAVSRARRQATAEVEWIAADLAAPETLRLPPFATLYCTVHAGLLARAL